MNISNVSLILGVLLSVANVGNWIRKYFNGAYKIKRNHDEMKKEVDRHEASIKDSLIKMDTVMTMINTLFEINKIQTRYSIVNACTEAIEKGNIEQYQLQSLEDMYTMYTDVLHGNSYVVTLMSKVRLLDIRQSD